MSDQEIVSSDEFSDFSNTRTCALHQAMTGIENGNFDVGDSTEPCSTRRQAGNFICDQVVTRYDDEVGSPNLHGLNNADFVGCQLYPLAIEVQAAEILRSDPRAASPHY